MYLPYFFGKGDFEMIANAVVIVCTVLMVGAVIWVVIGEHNAPDYDEKKENKNNKDKKDSEDRK